MNKKVQGFILVNVCTDCADKLEIVDEKDVQVCKDDGCLHGSHDPYMTYSVIVYDDDELILLDHDTNISWCYDKVLTCIHKGGAYCPNSYCKGAWVEDEEELVY